MIAEMFPITQLGKAMVVYVFCIAIGASLGPLFAGIIAQSLHNWRWFFTISAILLGFNLLFCILILPETCHNMTDDASMMDRTDTGTVLPKSSGHETNVEHLEMGTDASAERLSIFQLWMERSFYPRNFIRRQQRVWAVWLETFLLVMTPELFTTVLLWAACVGWVLVSAMIAATFYQRSPFFWNSEQVGLLNLGPLLGLVLGFPLGGIAADRRMATHSGVGAKDAAKERLPLLLPGAVISPVGCLLMGLTLQHSWHWMGFAAGFGMLAFSITSSCNILLTYSVDTFGSRAIHVGLVVHMVKYILSFGMTFGSIDWFFTKGPTSQFGTMAGTLWAIYLLSVPLYFRAKLVSRISTWVLSYRL
jgi:MFS family permease